MKYINATLLLLVLTLTGCKTIYSRGQFVEDAQVEQLMNKKMTKEQVVGLIGTPTIVSDYSKDTWFYAQRVMYSRAWFDPKVISQRVVKLVFSGNKLTEVEVFNDNHEDGIVVSEEYTKSPGSEKTYMQNFMKNFGKFNKKKKKKKNLD